MAARRSGSSSVLGLVVLLVVAIIGVANPGWIDSLASGVGDRLAGDVDDLPPAVFSDGDELALEVLAGITVKGKAPMTGYDRDKQFGPAWSDRTGAPLSGNGCDTRNDILGIFLSDRTYPDGDTCTVLSGSFTDPYTGKRIDFVRGTATSSQVHVDHVVALANVWESGGQQLTQAQREQVANDPLNLLPTSAAANTAKGKSNAAEWLPPNKAFRCEFIARQIAVKAKYDLSVTQPERDAMERVLSTCPDQKVPAQ